MAGWTMSAAWQCSSEPSYKTGRTSWPMITTVNDKYKLPRASFVPVLPTS